MAAALMLVTAAGCRTDGPTAGPGPNGSGGGSGGVHADVNLAVALETFLACDDLLASVREQALARVGPHGLPGAADARLVPEAVTIEDAVPRATGPASTVLAAPSAGAAPAPSSADGSVAVGGDAGYSATNNQEAGVDEPDTVKTDGRRIVTSRHGRLQIIDVTGAAPTLTGTVALPGGDGQLLLAGDRVLTMSSGGSYGADVMTSEAVRPGGTSVVGGSPTVVLSLVDIADGAHPRVLDTVSIDGSLVGARLVGGQVRLATSSSPTGLGFVFPAGSGAAAAEVAEQANRRVIEASTVEQWLPSLRHWSDGSPPTNSSPGTRLVDCAAVHHPKQFAGFSTLSLLTLDPAAATIDAADGVAVQADGQVAYASATAFYVATPAFVEPPGSRPGTTTSTTSTPTTAPSTTTTTVEPTPTTSPSGTTPGTTPGTAPAARAAEPRPERPGVTTAVPVPPPDDEEPVPTAVPVPPPSPVGGGTTSIHKFDISAPGPASYRASGSVAGTVTDQFSMSEEAGVLRVVSTTSPVWSTCRGCPPTATTGTESWLTTLGETDGELRRLGIVGGMGRGETVRGVRFIGTAGYVVTFRQTDPLYTLDLSDTSDPRVVGELHMLGYSAYLHPIGDGLLLGIGQDATATGRRTGTKIAVYDVHDLAQPREVSRLALSSASSLAEEDHHAFLWWDPTKLAVLPIDGGYDEGARFTGALGLRIDGDAITEVGRIVQSGRIGPVGGGTSGGIPCDPACPRPTPTTTVVCAAEPCDQPEPQPTWPTPYPAGARIERTLVVGDHLYALSAEGIQANSLDALRPETYLPLR